jgi:uncharacterized membrane protein YkvA (DUF1232 family)
MTTFPLESLYNWYRETIANPKYRWWIIGGTVLYVLSPIDLLPDVFPILGQVDDAILLTLLATEIGAILKDRNAAMKQKKADATNVTADTNATASSGSVDVNAVEVP